MEEKMLENLKKFGEVQIESENEVVVKTEPFHTLVTRVGNYYVVYSPSGVYRAASGAEVIRALKGMRRPDAVIYPQVVPFLEALKTEVKLFVNGNMVVRVPEIGRDLYINVPEVVVTGEDKPGAIIIMSTRKGKNDVLNEVLRIPFSSYIDAVRKLASLMTAINHGDIEKIYRMEAGLQQ